MKKILLGILSITFLYLFSLNSHAQINFIQQVGESKQKLILADAKNGAKYQKAIDSLIQKYTNNTAILSKIYKKLAKVKTKLGTNNPIGSKNYKIMAIVDYLDYSIMNELSKKPIVIPATGEIVFKELTDGYYIRKDTEGSIFAEFMIMNNKNEGDFILYHDNGKINIHSYYIDSKLEGEARIYTPLGELASIELYKNNINISTKKYNLSIVDTGGVFNKKYKYIEYFHNQDQSTLAHVYDKYEKKIYTFNYNADWELHGIQTIYAPQQSYETEPKIQNTTYYKNNIREGVDLLYGSRTTFNSDNTVKDVIVYIKQRAYYKNGKIHGTVIFYNIENAREQTTQYVDGVKHGDEIVYYTLGGKQTDKISMKRIYEHGIIVRDTLYNSDGTIK